MHLRRAGREQARRLGRMRSDRGQRVARGDGACELGISSDQVKRVGIEHQRHLLRQRSSEQAARRIARADAWAGDERVGTGIEHVGRALQHEFGLYPVDRRPLVRREPNPDFSGAEIERRASGENRGADHAGVAADDSQRAEAAFVHVAVCTPKRFWQCLTKQAPFEPPPARARRRI